MSLNYSQPRRYPNKRDEKRLISDNDIAKCVLTCEYTCSVNVSTGIIVMINLSPSVKICFSIPCLKKLHVRTVNFLSRYESYEITVVLLKQLIMRNMVPFVHTLFTSWPGKKSFTSRKGNSLTTYSSLLSFKDILRFCVHLFNLAM